jgi:hypothetical protein
VYSNKLFVYVCVYVYSYKLFMYVCVCVLIEMFVHVCV